MKTISSSILQLYSKLHKKESIVNFNTALTSAKSVLIFMPEKVEDFSAAKNFLRKFKQELPGKKVVICTQQQEINIEKNSHIDGIIFVTSDDVNFFGLPRKKLTQKIAATNFDMILDLNQDFQPVSSYLSRKSNAPLKVCLYNQQKEAFYNFAYRTSVQFNLEEQYNRLVHFLGRCVQ
ncbi:hypothetical protein B6D60_08320 [candidate division KSB1 bacterium 4484_87]|nr:MAG: hypothetical protein B6D60_08320 [candidate division KSB1 bacterium 4484_87]